ncbi:MAG: ABC transporter permease [Bacteroidales bacterium]|nr:ABC transporter permease [Bacteroidales bacterium]MBQ5802935.1 ABC transporter permease [Bacteroidales bacterium]MBQ8034128.1 ABC transporter permease [Bacteroidales bacterium]MBR4094939.1 ABC transporter permease [Bacteroidales bacterium]
MGKSKIGIIIGREYAIRVKKKSFIFTTILTPLLFAALMVVPSLIALYSSGEEGQMVKVVDESGIVMPYLESSKEIIFEQAAPEESLASLKENFKDSGLFAIIGISPLDSNKNLTITAYSEKQLNIDLQSQIRKSVNKAVEDNKLRAYNIPDLDRVLKDIESDVKMNTYTLDEQTGEEKESMVEIYMGIGYIASFLIYMFIFMFGSMVMRSVIDEKTTRIVEVIVSSVKPFQLMLGKIIGVAAVGLTQFLIWVVLTFAIVTGVSAAVGVDKIQESVTAGMPVEQVMEEMNVQNIDMQNLEVEESEFDGILRALREVNYIKIVVCFLIYFLLGYLLYSGMFAAVGSAVDNEADTQQLILPVTMPLIIGLFIMLHTFQYPDSSLSFWASVIPFTSPMVMMARIAYGVPAWELALSIGLLIVTFLILTYISGKIYRIGILMYGKKATWKDLWKWMKIR